MQAAGDHIVLIPPPVEDETKGGIVLPDQAKTRSHKHGRILSLGPLVEGPFTPGDIAVFDRAGMRSVEWGVGQEARQHWVITETMVLYTLTDQEAKERGWSVPPPLPTSKPVPSPGARSAERPTTVNRQIREATAKARA